MIYRAYRYPYEWVPQEEKPIEKEIKPVIAKVDTSLKLEDQVKDALKLMLR